MPLQQPEHAFPGEAITDRDKTAQALRLIGVGSRQPALVAHFGVSGCTMKIQLRSVEVFDNPSTLAVGRSWSNYPAVVCAYAKTECAALHQHTHHAALSLRHAHVKSVSFRADADLHIAPA